MLFAMLSHADAFLALPNEVKVLLLAAIILSMVLGIIRKIWKLVKISAVVGIIYMILMATGVIG